MPDSSASRTWVVMVVATALTREVAGRWLQVGEWRPDLLIVSLVYLGLTAGRTIAVLLGFVTGLYADLYVPPLLGTHSIAHTLVAYLAGMIGEKVQAEHLSVQALSLFLLYLFDATVVGLVSRAPDLPRVLLSRTLVSALYTTVLGLLVVSLLSDWLLPQGWNLRATTRRRRVR